MRTGICPAFGNREAGSVLACFALALAACTGGDELIAPIPGTAGTPTRPPATERAAPFAGSPSVAPGPSRPAEPQPPPAGAPAQDPARESEPASGSQPAAAPVPDPAPPDRPRSALVDPERWEVLSAESDPFDDRPASVSCTSAMPEVLSGELAFSVDTEDCNYVTVQQTSLRSVAPGDRIKIRLWHFDLSASQPAAAHAAVWLDGLPVYEDRIPIPQGGGLIVHELSAVTAVPEGA